MSGSLLHGRLGCPVKPQVQAVPLPTSEQYRKNAQECRANAREVGNIHERETLLRIAAMYDRLAEHKARSESGQT